MYFNGRKDIIEASDFAALHALDLEEIGGRQYIHLLVQVDASVKHFDGDEKPIILVVSDGVSQKLLFVQPMPEALPVASPVEAPVEAVAAPAVVETTPESSEHVEAGSAPSESEAAEEEPAKA